MRILRNARSALIRLRESNHVNRAWESSLHDKPALSPLFPPIPLLFASASASMGEFLVDSAGIDNHFYRWLDDFLLIV